jgi:hypothetical protein
VLTSLKVAKVLGTGRHCGLIQDGSDYDEAIPSIGGNLGSPHDASDAGGL